MRHSLRLVVAAEEAPRERSKAAPPLGPPPLTSLAKFAPETAPRPFSLLLEKIAVTCRVRRHCCLRHLPRSHAAAAHCAVSFSTPFPLLCGCHQCTFAAHVRQTMQMGEIKSSPQAEASTSGFCRCWRTSAGTHMHRWASGLPCAPAPPAATQHSGRGRSAGAELAALSSLLQRQRRRQADVRGGSSSANTDGSSSGKHIDWGAPGSTAEHCCTL